MRIIFREHVRVVWFDDILSRETVVWFAFRFLGLEVFSYIVNDKVKSRPRVMKHSAKSQIYIILIKSFKRSWKTLKIFATCFALFKTPDFHIFTKKQWTKYLCSCSQFLSMIQIHLTWIHPNQLGTFSFSYRPLPNPIKHQVILCSNWDSSKAWVLPD